jgi:hypothetical protein
MDWMNIKFPISAMKIDMVYSENIHNMKMIYFWYMYIPIIVRKA